MKNQAELTANVTDELHEECGVFGMYDFDGGDVAPSIYYGLFALQHRGQESCGIAVSDTDGPKGKVLTHKFITQSVWGSSWENDVVSLRVFMATLRRKLERGADSMQYIQTHIGIGYRMLKIEEKDG